MRIFGRLPDANGVLQWVVVDPSQNYLTALAQCLLLNVNESPFWANFGIDGQQSVMSQILPTVYVQRIQQFFAPFFTSLIITLASQNPPTYNVAVTTLTGVQLSFPVAM